MSPRIKVLRKISNPPIIKGFKPYGENPEKFGRGAVQLLYEEYEAIRLCDYESYNHHQASAMMGVSRPTFTRIYASALQKIATAFVEGRQISIEGGKVYFDSDWYHCKQCDCFFNNPEKDQGVDKCPLCGSNKVANFPNEALPGVEPLDDEPDTCLCPKCGFEQKHMLGEPYNRVICPRCHSVMRRKGKRHSNRLNE